MFNHAKPFTRQFLSLALASSISVSSGAILAPAVFAANGAAPSIQSTVGKRNSYVEVAVNKSRVIQLNTAINRVSVSDPNVVSIVVISPTEVQIIGKSVGNCSLLVWSESSGKNYLNIDISVHQDVATLNQKIQAIDPGIQVVPMAAQNAIILTGYASSREKAQLVYDLANAFYNSGATTRATGPGSSASAGSSFGTAGSSTRIINMIKIPGQPNTKSEMAQQRLKEISPGISLSVVPSSDGSERAILSGTVRSASDVSKAINIASIFYGSPGIRVVTGPGGNAPPAAAVGSTGGYSSSGGGAGLIGNMDKNILQGSFITDTSGNVVSLLQIQERPQIRCHIQILEVRKSVNFTSGFNAFSGGTNSNSQGGLGQRLTSTQGTNSGQTNLVNTVNQTTIPLTDGGQIALRLGRDLALYVSGLVNDGKARVLAEPNITTISGEPATFLAGGEYPIPVTSTNGQVSIVYKEFGVRLNILPTMTERETVHMQVSPEVSSLDTAAGVTFGGGVIPGLRTRRSQAVVEMADGENFVLSGLYNEDYGNTVQKTPFLGQIPILGELFKSRTFQNSETELVIIVRPEVLSTPVTASHYNSSLIPLSSSVPTPAPTAMSAPEETALLNLNTTGSPSSDYTNENQKVSFTFPESASENKSISNTDEKTTTEIIEPYGLKSHQEDVPIVKLTAKPFTTKTANTPPKEVLEVITPEKAAQANLNAKTKVVIETQQAQKTPLAIKELENQKTTSLLDEKILDKVEPTYIEPENELTAEIIPDTKVLSTQFAGEIAAPSIAVKEFENQKTTSLLDEKIPDKVEPTYIETQKEAASIPVTPVTENNDAKPLEAKLEQPINIKEIENQKTTSLLDTTENLREETTQATINTRPNTTQASVAAPINTPSLHRAIESALESAFPIPEATNNKLGNGEKVGLEIATQKSIEQAANSPEQSTESLLSEEDMSPSINAEKRPRLYQETIDVVMENLEAQLKTEYEETIKSALNKRPKP